MGEAMIFKYGTIEPRDSPGGMVLKYGVISPRPNLDSDFLKKTKEAKKRLKSLIDMYLDFLSEVEELAYSGTLEVDDADILIADLRSELGFLRARVNALKRNGKGKKRPMVML